GLRPRGPGGRPAGPEQRVRARRAGARRGALAGGDAPRPPERRAHAGRAGDPPVPGGAAGLGRPVVPRARGPAAAPGVGRAPHERPRLPRPGALAGELPGPRHPGDGPRPEPPRERAAGRARPATDVTEGPMPTAPPSRRVIAARRPATGRRTPGRWALLVAIGIGGCVVAEPGPPPVYVPGPRAAAPAA